MFDLGQIVQSLCTLVPPLENEGNETGKKELFHTEAFLKEYALSQHTSFLATLDDERQVYGWT